MHGRKTRLQLTEALGQPRRRLVSSCVSGQQLALLLRRDPRLGQQGSVSFRGGKLAGGLAPLGRSAGQRFGIGLGTGGQGALRPGGSIELGRALRRLVHASGQGLGIGLQSVKPREQGLAALFELAIALGQCPSAVLHLPQPGGKSVRSILQGSGSISGGNGSGI